MSGLSYFEDGGTTTPEEKPEAVSTGVRVQPQSPSKSLLALPKPTGEVELGAGVLRAMEELYNQKLAQQSSFSESLKDALAWASGGVRGPTEALARRDEQRAKQEADLFNIQSQLAQYKAAQEAQKGFQQERAGILNTGGAQPAGGAAMGVDLSPEERLILSRAPNRAEFNKILQNLVTKRSEALAQPGAQEPKFPVFMLSDRQVHDVSLPMKQRLIREGKAVDIGSELPPEAPAAMAPAPAAMAPAPAAMAPAPAAMAPAPAAPGGALPVASAATLTGALPTTEDRFRFENLTPDQIRTATSLGRNAGLQSDVLTRPDAAELFNARPLAARKAFFESPSLRAAAPEAPTQMAAAPSATVTDVTAPVAPRKPALTPRLSDIRAEQEFRKGLDAETVKLWSKDQEQHTKDLEGAGLREINSREIINTLKKDPQISGLLQVPGRAAAFATLLKTGISAPGGHSIGIKEIDDVMFKGMPGRTPEEVRARDRLRTLLDTAALHAREILKGGGQISDFEQKMLQSMVGSLDNSPENIVKIHMIFEENAKQRQKLDEAWKRSGVRNYGEFKATSPEYKKLQAEYNDRLRKLADEKVVLPRGEAAVHPGRSLLDKYPPKGKK